MGGKGQGRNGRERGESSVCGKSPFVGMKKRRALDEGKLETGESRVEARTIIPSTPAQACTSLHLFEPWESQHQHLNHSYSTHSARSSRATYPRPSAHSGLTTEGPSRLSMASPLFVLVLCQSHLLTLRVYRDSS
jgi:hypothetical protein